MLGLKDLKNYKFNSFLILFLIIPAMLLTLAIGGCKVEIKELTNNNLISEAEKKEVATGIIENEEDI